ncbi:twin-arginine translocation signal domain-containing protein [Desulfonatronovibrio hydrogenovorans]|uniref:twin-arginine translocation signal domain-containing protein n=1 Tax=Desulfonatronovibrio hydrogenovorans TaxID=53245 RepID=UPI00048EBB1E|nr:twin-arginine translocation signal domain-containing protein [Desulfonatronovibrio hydrogenovorans]
MSNQKKSLNRRDFIKGASVGALGGLFATMGVYSYSPWRKNHLPEIQRSMTDIGTCRRVKITNISETSWFDNAKLMGDIHGAGGLLVNQYLFNWPPFGDGGPLARGSYQKGIEKIKHLLPHDLDKAWSIAEKNSIHPENAGGFAALIEVEGMDGSITKYLLDSGWSFKWMDDCFKREGVDQMLEAGEIQALFISHEHFDHFWGLPVTYKYDPGITTYIPAGFYPEGLQYIKDSGHKGELKTIPAGLHRVQPGMALYSFGVPIICRVFGEQSLYFNVKDLGLVSVTGCCHQGIIQFADTAYRELKYENDQLHGIYGGLHISPFEDWDPKYDDLVIAMEDWGFEKIGCNHCTGIVTARKFLDMGYNVVEGSARHGSVDPAYLGNGDVIEFKA